MSGKNNFGKNNLILTKAEARSYFQNKRNQLSQNQINSFSHSIFENWEKLDFFQLSSYHIFLSITEKKEIDTSLILNDLLKKNKTVYCPKVIGNSLEHYKIDAFTQYKKNKWNIPEPLGIFPVKPKKIEVIFIPLLGTDIQGNRVGYGKGYYDRFLSEYTDSVKIGLSLFAPIQKIADITEEDIPLDYLITPNHSFIFSILEK